MTDGSQMARGKKKKQYRKKFTGINITNALEGYSYVHIWSNAIFESNPATFLFDTGGAGGSPRLNLREIIDSLMGGTGGVGTTDVSHAYARGDRNAFDVMATNAQDNWLDASFKTVGTGIGWRVGKKLTSKPRSYANKLIKQVGLGDMIKF